MLNHDGFPGLVDIFISSRPLSAWNCTGTLSSIENCTVIIILIVWLFRSSDFKNQRFLQPSKQWKPILIQWQHSLGNDHFLSLIIVIGPNGFQFSLWSFQADFNFLVTSMITGWIEERKILWPVYQNYNKTLERTSVIEFNCGRSWKMTENDVYVKVKRKKMLSLRDRLQVIPKLSWLLTMQNNKTVLEKVLKRCGIQRFSKKVQT